MVATTFRSFLHFLGSELRDLPSVHTHTVHTLSTLCSLPSEIGLKYTCESTCSHTCDFRIPKVYNIPLDFGDCVAAPKPKQEV